MKPAQVQSRIARALASPVDNSARCTAPHASHAVEPFMLTEQLVGVLRGAGLSANAGTINHPELLGRVLEFAPDAIGTDRPHELRAEAEWRSAPALSG